MRVLVTGASGQLGAYLLRELVRDPDLEVVAWSGSTTGSRFGIVLRPVDLGNRDAVAAAFQQARPDAILHAGALASIADCYREPVWAEQINVGGTLVLAEAAQAMRARLVLISTDLVFDGEQAPYRESAPPAPLSHYGRTKVAAERAVLDSGAALVVRISLLFGPSLCGRPNFFDQQLAAVRTGQPLSLFADEWRTPLSLATAAQALVALLRSDVHGILHLGGPERLSRLEMGQRLAASLGRDSAPFIATLRSEASAAEPRPRDVSLDSGRWRSLFPALAWPAWEEALQELGVG